VGSLDVPELFMIPGLPGSLGLAVYNWTQRQ